MRNTPTTLLSMFLLLPLSACDDDPDAPATEQGETDENDPAAPEDDPSAPAAPPANWSKLSTSTAPTSLNVYANGSETNAGTGATLKLTYVNKLGTYSCTVAGVPSGTTRSCTPSKTGSTTHSTDIFYLAFATSSNTDGLRFSSVGVTISGTSYSKDSFDREWNPFGDSDLDCTGCSNGTSDDCGSCYLDGNNHTDCINAQIPMDNGDLITCAGYS